MQKLSELVGKKVISLYEASAPGTVINALFSANLQRVKYFELFNDDEESALFFPPSSIFALSDTLTLKNGAHLTGRFSLESGTVACPINLPVYTPYGKYLGCVSDFVLEGSKVISIVIGESEYSPSLVMRRSEEMLILNDSGKRIPLSPPRQAQSVPIEESQAPSDIIEESAPQPAPTAEVSQASVSVMPTVTPEPPQESAETSVDIPVKLRNDEGETKAGGYSFLIGKKVTKTLYAMDEILANEGDIISESLINKANTTGKLVLLALYST